MTRNATQELASILLGKPVEQFIAERRAAGRSWAKLARDLYEATNGRIDVSFETLRRWLPAEEPAQRVTAGSRKAS